METLQGLSAYLFAAEERARRPVQPSSYDLVAALAGEADAKALAYAFATSHQTTDVWAALRFHRASGNNDLTPWLMGHVFAAWHTGHDRDMSELAVSELREMAGEWSEKKS